MKTPKPKPILSPFAQAYYHIGCASKHLYRAWAALPCAVRWSLVWCVLVGALLISSGCQMVPALKPGRAAATLSTPTTPAAVSVQTPENPGTPTTQSVERTTTRRFAPAATPTAAPAQAAAPLSTPASPMVAQTATPLLEETTYEKAIATVGAAQADTSREISARLAIFKPVQLAGVGFLLFAAALFHPVLRKTVGGGKSVQVALAVGGVVLIFGPTLFVGRENLVLLLIAVAVAGWWLNSRASYHEGRADSIKQDPSPSASVK